jgi:hypothetical protein
VENVRCVHNAYRTPSACGWPLYASCFAPCVATYRYGLRNMKKRCGLRTSARQDEKKTVLRARREGRRGSFVSNLRPQRNWLPVAVASHLYPDWSCAARWRRSQRGIVDVLSSFLAIGICNVVSIVDKPRWKQTPVCEVSTTVSGNPILAYFSFVVAFPDMDPFLMQRKETRRR